MVRDNYLLYSPHQHRRCWRRRKSAKIRSRKNRTQVLITVERNDICVVPICVAALHMHSWNTRQENVIFFSKRYVRVAFFSFLHAKSVQHIPHAFVHDENVDVNLIRWLYNVQGAQPSLSSCMMRLCESHFTFQKKKGCGSIFFFF